MNPLYLILALVLLSLLYRFFLARALLQLSVTRQFSKPAVFEGESGEMTEIISNPSALPIVWLRLESSISNALQFSGQHDLYLNGDRHIESLFTFLPHQRIIRRYPVHFKKRGNYSVSSSALTAGDVTGLCQVMQETTCSADILVWPRLLNRSVLLSFPLGISSASASLDQDPSLYRGLREYRAGDPIRSIHWPSSAKVGKTMIKQHDPVGVSRFMILLNGQKHAEQWGDLMDYEKAEIEYAISLAATLSVHYLTQGCQVGFATNLKTASEANGPYIAPRAGSTQKTLILNALARLQIHLGLRLETYLSSLPLTRDMHIILLTYYLTPSLEAAIGTLRQKGFEINTHLIRFPQKSSS